MVLFPQASSRLCGYAGLVFALVSVARPGAADGSDPSAAACGAVLRAGMGLISSPRLPGFPRQYPDSLRCEWTITAPRSRRVKLDFSTFDLQSSSDCGADYLKIIPDGENENSSLSTVHCGQALPPPTLSTGHVLRLLFVTDETHTGTGFNVFYETVGAESPDAPVIVWLEQNLSDKTAKLQSLPADPADYLTSGNIVTNTILRHQPALWNALAADYLDRNFFWSDPQLKLIWHGVIEGEQLVATPLYRGTSSKVAGLAVDWLARTVYWTDATYNWIMVSSYEGSRHLTVVEGGLDSPSGIAVHPMEGWLFWADRGRKPKIERSRLNGQDRQVLASTEASHPVGLTIDYTLDRLFWTAHNADKTSSIFSASIHGESVTEHARVDYNYYVFNDLAIFKEYLFVSDSTNQLHCYYKNSTRGFYFSFNLRTRQPFGIATYAESNQAFDTSGCDSAPCQYLCVSGGAAGHTCLCRPGQHAEQDGSCVRDSDVLIAPPKLFLAGRDSICVYPGNFPDMPLSTTGGASPGQCILRRLPRAAAIAADVREGQLFYSTLGDNAIYGVRLRNNANTVEIVGGTGGVHGIAVDWLSKLLYWSDSRLNHIAVSRYDGRQRKILLREDLLQPGSLALDPHERLMFWTYMGSRAQIERAGLDGSNRVVIVREAMEPQGITLDYDTRTLYFADKGAATIQSVDYAGQARRKVFEKRDALFTGLELYKDYLLWTEWSPSNELNAVNRETGEHVRRLPLNGVVQSAHGVAMYAKSRQPDGQAPCSDNTHGCQQLCLPAPLPFDFVCACAVGYTLAEDEVSCASDLVHDNFILVTDTHLHGIYQVDLMTPDPTLQALPLANVSNPLSIGYDPLLGMVYWSDVIEGTISRTLLVGGSQEVVVHPDEGQVPYSLVVDSNSRLLYWTDVGTNSIKVCRLDGAHQRTLVNTSASPRAIATLPNDGLMFWTWWGEDGAGIGKASMDGTEPEVLLSAEGGFLHGLTVDANEGRLYWTDAQSHTIESMDFRSGSGRRSIPLGTSSHPFGLALGVNSVYWTDQRSRMLMRADAATGANAATVGSLDLARPNDIHLAGRDTTIVVNNACSLSNGGCGGLCLPTPIGRTCACADGIGVTQDGACLTADNSTDTTEELEFTSRPHDVTLELGMEIHQKCSSNQPSARVEWKKDFIPLPLGNSNGVYVLTDGELLILDVGETHRGLYTCTITGTSGEVIESTAEFQFDPEDVFQLTPESVVIPEGEDYILTCSARKASYVIRWEKNSAPVELSDMVHVISGDSLVIRQAIVSDSGKYTCVAQTLDGARVAEVTARVTVTSRQVVEAVCGTVTSPEALGLSQGSSVDGEEEEEGRTFRITGGVTAKRGSSPWIARLWVIEDRKHFCGGTLLNRYWVLTGAHCITEYSVDKDDIKIRLGDHDSYSTEEDERFVGVQHIKVYDDFLRTDYDMDLALIKLAEPVDEFTDYLRPVCLPTKQLARQLLKSGVKGKVVGWGALVEEGPYPRYLTEVEVPVVGQRKCIESTPYRVSDNMFCAGYKKKKGDACRGDSGGPFSIEHEGRWYQLGIVSWGEGCGRPGKYGFYTRLVKFLKWIDSYMESH